METNAPSCLAKWQPKRSGKAFKTQNATSRLNGFTFVGSTIQDRKATWRGSEVTLDSIIEEFTAEVSEDSAKISVDYQELINLKIKLAELQSEVQIQESQAIKYKSLYMQSQEENQALEAENRGLKEQLLSENNDTGSNINKQTGAKKLAAIRPRIERKVTPIIGGETTVVSSSENSLNSKCPTALPSSEGNPPAAEPRHRRIDSLAKIMTLGSLRSLPEQHPEEYPPHTASSMDNLSRSVELSGNHVMTSVNRVYRSIYSSLSREADLMDCSDDSEGPSMELSPS